MSHLLLAFGSFLDLEHTLEDRVLTCCQSRLDQSTDSVLIFVQKLIDLIVHRPSVVLDSELSDR